MALGDNPVLKRPSPFSDDDTGLGAAALPPRLQPGQAAPDVNPAPLGTQIGGGLRRAFQGAVNNQVDLANAAIGTGVAATNALSYPARATLGVERDVKNGLLGQAPDPNAGQPAAGLAAPQLQRPFTAPAVNFAETHNDVPTLHPGFGDTAGGVASSAPPGFGDVQGGVLQGGAQPMLTRGPTVTVSAGQPAIDSGTTVNGRALPYGAMVNGVPTYSDGSGTGAIPRTMADSSIKDLGSRLQIAPPQVNALASDALGYTPSSEQMAALVRPTVQPITGSRPSAEQFAEADRNAIALRDPRSMGGIAARNAMIDAQYGGTGRVRAQAAKSLDVLEGGGLQSGLQRQQADAGLAQTDAQGANQLAGIAAQGQTALAQENLRGQYGLQNTGLEIQRAQLQRQGHPVTRADGTLGVMDPLTAKFTPSQDAEGSPVKALVAKTDADDKRTYAVTDQIAKGAQELAKGFVPSKDQPAATPQMIAQWREQSARALGLRVGTDGQGRRVVDINGQVTPL